MKHSMYFKLDYAIRSFELHKNETLNFDVPVSTNVLVNVEIRAPNEEDIKR